MKKARNEEQPTRKYQPGDQLTLSEAAALFAHRNTRPHETMRASKSRWRKRIEYALAIKNLSQKNRKFEIEYLVSWALNLTVKEVPDWPSKLTDLPRLSEHRNDLGESAQASDCVLDISLPGTLERCHSEIRRITHENEALKQRLSHLQEEINLLRPKAERYQENCERNRKSGGIRQK